ncbi:cytochrome c biogenesis ATP-binding export protein CcmA [Litorimonas cladophorae]|uniref:Cytochrome c biogenesis ATP-binding export protein CcmA n=1 Tax=Litorimonas cladophorae TaxID=1220491 RepID=A0A918KDJ2_9PROT|nr:heme ABC exporter ATP-binding protein CcmA [Litorimonas cladophorae]GGX58060.1 cytochrome c biogenesis ATP-binding export protein CcmA [Litorimonas cladophorae]
MMKSATLTLKDVDIVRGSRTLVSGLNLTLSGPKLLWVEGGNGIGKTSLLRTCAGLSRPAAGRITWSVQETTLSAPETVTFLPADSYAKSGLEAGEDAAFWGADLETVDMLIHAKTPSEKLSTGQAKRLSFAKMLATQKPIWILDEPLAGLDKSGRDMVAHHLRAHVLSGGLALVASHAPISVRDVPTQRLVLT